LQTNGEIAARVHFGRAIDGAIIANCHDWSVYVGDTQVLPNAAEPWNPILALVTACYVASRVTKALLGDALSAAADVAPFSILDFGTATASFDWEAPLPVGNVHVAGVGAVGSAFLFALASHGRATGSLDLIDPDAVDRPNLGRYVLFDVADVPKPKVTAAKARLDAVGCPVEVRAHEALFEKYFDERYDNDNSFRVGRLVCCPDSRPARREFQSKLPFETFDASTGPSQVVVHQNRYDPSEACVECIYPRILFEDAHAEHVARKLNVPLERVRSGQNIAAGDAERIVAAYPNLRAEDLVGRAFDSIFRSLCGAGELRVEDEVVLAPMPFTSALAGVLLYFELVKASAEAFAPFRSFNYVQLNPLFAPNPLMREMRGSNPSCRCQDPATRGLFNRIWGDRLDRSTASGAADRF